MITAPVMEELKMLDAMMRSIIDKSFDGVTCV